MKIIAAIYIFPLAKANLWSFIYWSQIYKTKILFAFTKHKYTSWNVWLCLFLFFPSAHFISNQSSSKLKAYALWFDFL